MVRDVWEDEEHAQDLVAAYVLGAVTPQEARLVEAHLATCVACQEVERTLGEVVAQLPALVGEMTPPTGQRERLMAIVAEEAQSNDWPPSLETPSRIRQDPTAIRPISLQRAGASTSARPWKARVQGSGMRLAAPLVALAAMLTLVVLGVGLWRTIGGNQTPATAVYRVAGTTTQPSIAGTLSYFGGDHRIELNVRGLAALPSNRVYALWLIRGHYRVIKRIDTFRAAADGTARITLDSDNPANYTMACLSVEETATAQRPTMPLVATASIL